MYGFQSAHYGIIHSTIFLLLYDNKTAMMLYIIVVVGVMNKHPAAMELRENPAYDSRYQPHTVAPSAEVATTTLERRQLEHTYESLSDYSRL